MRFPIVTVVAFALAAATVEPIQPAIRAQSGTLRVETPANNPELVVENVQVLFPHITRDGKTLLPIEKQDGGKDR